MATAQSGPGYSVQEYFHLYDVGLIADDDRTELLDGVIVSMAPQAPKHASVVARLNELMLQTCPPSSSVRVQLPLVLGESSVPEPDIAIVPAREDYYADEHPHTALLIVEVADSSVGQDRLTKSRIYAASGIEHYWIVNVRDRSVEVLGAPDTKARVYEHRRVQRFGALGCAALPGVTVEVAELFPKPIA